MNSSQIERVLNYVDINTANGSFFLNSSKELTYSNGRLYGSLLAVYNHLCGNEDYEDDDNQEELMSIFNMVCSYKAIKTLFNDGKLSPKETLYNNIYIAGGELEGLTSGCSYRNSYFENCELVGDFTNCCFWGSKFVNVQMKGNFRLADLSFCTFNRVNAEDGDFGFSKMIESRFSKSRFAKTDYATASKDVFEGCFKSFKDMSKMILG
jgi:uncharacterized protein YjbI with pentapeptide repeats